MEVRCKVCGLLKHYDAHLDRQGRCPACSGAYQRFRHDVGWGMKQVGGFRTKSNGDLVYDGPAKAVPNVPSGNWFRYIVRERLLRGLSRYPYTYAAYEDKFQWHPDKMPPWPDMHMMPSDDFVIPPRQAIALGLVDVPHEEPDPRLSEVGPWGPPVVQ